MLEQNYQQPLVKVAHHTPMVEAIAQMYQAQSSCVLVLNTQELVGIVTQTDIVRAIAHQINFADMTIGELMSQPVITVNETEAQDITIVLQRFQQHPIRHLPIVDSGTGVLGVITLEAAKTAQMAQLLSHTETRLNDILNSAIATSIVSFRVFLNSDWEYDYQSPGCETLFGYTSQEFLSNKYLWLSRVHPQDLETVIMPGFADIFAGNTFNFEYRFYHKDGSLRWIGATHSSRYDAEANCWMVTATNIDISERKQAEAALRHSEERWQLAIAGTDEAIWDWDIVTNYTFRSDRWFEMLGYEPHELSSFDDEWSIRIHPDDYGRVMAEQAAYLRRQVPFYSSEYRLRRKDGSYRWFRSRAKAVWDEAGNPIRLVGSLGEITEQKAALRELQQIEAELRQRKHFIEQVINHSAQLLYIFNPITGSNVFLNRQSVEILGYTPEEIQERGAQFFSDVLHPDDLPLLERNQNYWKNAPDGDVLTTECRMKHKDGAWRWLRSREVVFARDENNRPSQVLGTTQDITDSKLAELEILQNRDLLAAIYSGSADALFLVNPHTLLIMDCNQRAVELFAASSKAELIGTDGQNLQKRRFTDEEVASVIEELHHQGFWSREVEYITKQGNSFWGNLAVKQIYVVGEEIHLVRVTDTTQRKLAELALYERETMLRSIGDNLPNGAVYQVIRELDGSDRLTYISAGIERIKEIKVEDALQDISFLHSQFIPEDVPGFQQAVDESMRHLSIFDVQLRIRTRSGVLKWLHFVLLIPEGRDITERQAALRERQQAEQALQEKEHFLSSIYEGVGNPIFVVDVVDGDFYFAGLNPAHERLTGLLSRELKGKTPEQVLPPAEAATVRQHYQDCLKAGQTITYVENLYLKDQDTWWITSITPLKDENQSIYRIVGSSINITEQKRAQKMLELQAVITRNMAEGLCLIRENDGVIVYTNPKFEQIFGYDAGELIGQHISIINYENEHTIAEEVHQGLAKLSKGIASAIILFLT
jgi:PAS domain S-box-containing protein